MSKDLIGNKLEVGDTVAFCMVGYSQLQVGSVVKLTPKGATVSNDNHHKLSRASYQLVKIN